MIQLLAFSSLSKIWNIGGWRDAQWLEHTLPGQLFHKASRESLLGHHASLANALPTQPSLQFQNGTWFPYLPKPFVSNADTREKFLFLLHTVGYKSWSLGLLLGSLKGSIETPSLFFFLRFLFYMHWSYWTQILTAEPSLQAQDWFSDRSRVLLGLGHSCPDFSGGCHYCVLWDLIWHTDLWTSLFNDAGMCFPHRKVLYFSCGQECRKWNTSLILAYQFLIPGWKWVPVIFEAHPSLYSQIIAVFWSFPFPLDSSVFLGHIPSVLEFGINDIKFSKRVY